MGIEGQGATERIKRLEDRFRVLSEIMHAFAEATTDYERLLVAVARRVAEQLKNTCTVQILSADATILTPVAIHATDPAVLDRVRLLLAADPIHVESHALYRRLLGTGEALLVPRIDLAEHRRQASPAHGDITAALGMHSGLLRTAR